jgi:hypothetical protein
VEFRVTDIGREAWATAGKIIGGSLPGDLDSPQLVVLSCDNMTAGRGDPANDGPAVSLHERFLWRLFGGDHSLYKRYQPHFADKSKIAEAIGAIGRPVLILVDEILDYVRQLSLAEHADLANQDIAFLRALTDTVNDVPHAAMSRTFLFGTARRRRSRPIPTLRRSSGVGSSRRLLLQGSVGPTAAATPP